MHKHNRVFHLPWSWCTLPLWCFIAGAGVLDCVVSLKHGWRSARTTGHVCNAAGSLSTAQYLHSTPAPASPSCSANTMMQGPSTTVAAYQGPILVPYECRFEDCKFAIKLKCATKQGPSTALAAYLLRSWSRTYECRLMIVKSSVQQLSTTRRYAHPGVKRQRAPYQSPQTAPGHCRCLYMHDSAKATPDMPAKPLSRSPKCPCAAKVA